MIIGHVERNPHFEGSQSIDALALPFNTGDLAPHRIYGNKGTPLIIRHESVARLGENVVRFRGKDGKGEVRKSN